MQNNKITLFKKERLPRKPYCSDNKTATDIRYLSDALTKKYIQFNPPGMLVWMVFDIDSDSAISHYEDVGAPVPNIIVTNKNNGKGHYYYLLKTPVNIGKNGREKPKLFAQAVYKKLCYLLKADSDYAGLLAKNPLHGDFYAYQLTDESYELIELNEYLKPIDSFARSEEEVEGRNCQLFSKLRKWSYGAVEQYKNSGTYEHWLELCLSMAEQFNCFPDNLNGNLSFPEVKSIAKSVSKWSWHNYVGRGSIDSEFLKYQSELGKRKGLKLREQLLKKAQILSEEGQTQRHIADQLGLSQKTISNWLRYRCS